MTVSKPWAPRNRRSLPRWQLRTRPIAAIDVEIVAITTREQEVLANLAAAQQRLTEAEIAEQRAQRQVDIQLRRLHVHAIDVYVSGIQGDADSAKVLALLDRKSPSTCR